MTKALDKHVKTRCGGFANCGTQPSTVSLKALPLPVLTGNSLIETTSNEAGSENSMTRGFDAHQ
jgi:hypothetical protein